MSASVFVKQGLQLSRREISRYLGCRGKELEPQLSELVEQAARKVEQASYRVSWLRLPVFADGENLQLGSLLQLRSRDLARHLEGCRECVLFCATLGPSIDRNIRAGRLQPSKALIWDAVGTAGIEQLCDDFCNTLPKPQKSRYSPGYGDLDLELQRPILSLLDADQLLGVSLTESLLMIPTKSVTAIVGLTGETP